MAKSFERWYIVKDFETSSVHLLHSVVICIVDPY